MDRIQTNPALGDPGPTATRSSTRSTMHASGVGSMAASVGARNHGLLPSASGRPVQLSKSVRSPGSLAETLCTPAGRTADLKRNPIACRSSQRGRADFRHGMVRWWLPPTHSSWGCRDVCVSTVSIVIRRDRRVLCRMRNSQFDATIVATISSRPRWMVLIRWSGRC